MSLFEKIKKNHEDKILAKAKLIEAERQAEQERLRKEQEKLEAERKIQEEQRKLEEEQRKEKLKEEREKILAMKAPRSYIVECKSERTKYVGDKKYKYQRNDYFLCDTPRSDLKRPYSQYKFKKISGEDFGEVFTSVEDGEIKIVDLQGRSYTKVDSTDLALISDGFGAYTIQDFNGYLEKFNNFWYLE